MFLLLLLTIIALHICVIYFINTLIDPLADKSIKHDYKYYVCLTHLLKTMNLLVKTLNYFI